MKGIFKIGFSVTDFNSWMTHFENSKVNFRGSAVEDPNSGKRMIILLDPDGNRIQIFEK